jgi:hypothetical protein
MKILYIAVAIVTLSSCGSYIIISPMGDLNMVSTRNIETKQEYQKLKTYAGVDKKQIDNAIATSKGGKLKKRSAILKEIMDYEAKSLDESINNVVKSQIGGEYLMNVSFYSVTEYKQKANKLIVTTNYIASGDVWGTKTEEDNIKGFKKGNKIVFTYDKEAKKLIGKVFEGDLNKQYQGSIVELKSATSIIKMDSGQIIELPYTKITKLED